MKHEKPETENSIISNFLKILILLSPLPFGCVGRIFSPLFLMLILVLSFIVLGQPGGPVQFLDKKKIRYVFIAFLGFLGFQLLPLPPFLLKLVSPATANHVFQLTGQLTGFHPISMVPFETMMFGFRFLVYALFFLALLHVRFKKKEMISIFKILVLSSVLQVILGLLKYLHGNKYFFLFFHKLAENDPLQKYLTGTLGNPNHFAFYLGMVLPLFLALLFLKLQFLEAGKSLREKIIAAVDKNKWLLLYAAVPVLLGAGIILTGSRSGIVTMILCFLIFGQLAVYLKQGKSIRRKLAFFFIVITAAVLFIGVQTTVNKFLSTSFESSGRFLRWPATLNMSKDFLILGAGFGTYRYSYFLYDPDEGGNWSTHAHNDYLEIFAEGGIIGSILFFLLIGMVIFSIIRMWWARGHPEIKVLGIGIITSLFAVAFHSFFDFSLRIPANVFVFVLIMALGIKLVTYKREFKV
jgi:O-antigen ligase